MLKVRESLLYALSAVLMVLVGAVSAPVQAAGLADLTAAIDVGDVETALVAGGVIMMGIIIVMWGIHKVIGLWGKR
ncbi:MAG: hypothetical protein RKO24_17405 [Candidatus Competibacter sp.]|nr:hypothetical protein [Candidatus Competibacter sp.]